MRRIRVHRKLPRLFVFLLAALALGGAPLAQVPPHLDIASATVQELPPIDRDNVPGRGVALRLAVSAVPVCNAGTGFLAYGFLIDADSNPATGVSMPPFDILGVEARVTAVCDPASGLFVSPIGTVAVIPGPGAATIEIRTTVDRLPSLGFRWVAFAQDGMVFSRLPQAPEYVFWTTHEKGVF
jgi:hypothetical protein